MAGNANSLPRNVHFIRTGLVSKPLSTCSTVPVNLSQSGATHQVQGIPAKPVTPLSKSKSAATAQEIRAPPEVKSAPTSDPFPRIELKTTEDSAKFRSTSSKKELLQDDQAGFKSNRLNEQMEGDLVVVSGNARTDQVQADPVTSGNPGTHQAERGQESDLGETLKEHINRGEVSASANACVKQVGEGQGDSPSSGLAARNGHLGLRGNEASTRSDSMNKDNVMGMSVKCTTNDESENEDMFNNKNVAKGEEGPVIMDVGGNDGQEKAKQQDAGVKNGSK